MRTAIPGLWHPGCRREAGFVAAIRVDFSSAVFEELCFLLPVLIPHPIANLRQVLAMAVDEMLVLDEFVIHAPA